MRLINWHCPIVELISLIWFITKRVPVFRAGCVGVEKESCFYIRINLFWFSFERLSAVPKCTNMLHLFLFTCSLV